MAAYFVLFILSMISFEAASSQNILPLYVPGVPTLVTIKGDDPDPFKCSSNHFGTICANCSTQAFCAGEGSPINTVTCAKIDPKKPYCSRVKGICTDTNPGYEGCEDSSISADFKCTFDGYAPDPKDCKVYYYCQVGEKKITRYECPNNYVYDHSKKNCKQQKYPADCALMKCTPGKPFVEYAPDKSIYGVCDGNNKITVFQCEDEQNEWFNVETVSCKLSCRKEGPFADRRNCKAFYNCYYIDGKWDLTHGVCPTKTQFDKEKLQCVPETGTPCKNEIKKE